MINKAEYSTAAPLQGVDGIDHCFFSRHGGVSAGLYASLNAGLGSDDDRGDVLKNRARMCAELGVENDQLATPYQIHSNICVATDKAWETQRPEADAVVTNTPNLAVGVVTADCGPVLFADPVARVVGAAHAGWKGALGGVLENTIMEMQKLGATPPNVTAVLGPTISIKNYEVGPDFPGPFIKASGENARFFAPSVKPDHFMFDLPAYIVNRLQLAGINASDTNQCTYDSDGYFSYRRTTHRKEPDYGRQLSAIVLR